MRDFNIEALVWDDDPVRRKMAHDVFSAMKKGVPFSREWDIMDFGCGTGLIAFQSVPLVRSVLCADPSQGMLSVVEEKARSAGLDNVRTLPIDAGSVPSFPGAFDCILSSMTFHHIKDIPPLLSSLFDALNPGGYICVADLDLDDGLFHSNADGVFHNGFGRDDVCSLFAEAGFSDIRIDTAAEVEKMTPSGSRLFAVFAATARKK